MRGVAKCARALIAVGGNDPVLLPCAGKQHLQTAYQLILAVADGPDNLCLPKYWLRVLPYSEIVVDADVFCVLQVTSPRFAWREAANNSATTTS